MAEITAVTPGADGAQLLLQAAAGGDTFTIRANRALVVANANGSSVTATFTVPGNTATGEAVPDNAIAIPTGETWVIPLLDVYDDPTLAGKQGAVAWSATTGVTRRVLQL
jgi:hypothetical protein